MPLVLEIRSAEGNLLKIPPEVPPAEVGYVKNYRLGQLATIIGGECLKSDTGGIVHVIEDPWLIQMINSGIDVRDIISDETAAIGLFPEEQPVSIPFITQKGHRGSVAIRHSFPDRPIVYN